MPVSPSARSPPVGRDVASYSSSPKSSFVIGTTPVRSKYRNVPVTVAGRRYASKLEARFAVELDLRRKAGDILGWLEQVPFLLEGGVCYRTDFIVLTRAPSRSGDYEWQQRVELEVVDCKGQLLNEARNKLKQVHDRYNIIVMIYRRDGSLLPYTQVPVSRRGS